MCMTALCSFKFSFDSLSMRFYILRVLRHFGLLVDMQRRRLIDTHTHLHIQGVLSADPSPSPSICPKDATTPTILSCRSSQPSHASAHQILLPSMILLTSSRPQALQSQPAPDAWHQTVFVQPSKSSNTCSSLVSSDPRPVLGPRPYTWCQRSLPMIGVPVETIVL